MTWDLRPTAVAAEICRRFNRKMAAGGEIDRILAGGQVERRPALSDDEIERIKRNIGIQLDEYAQEINSASRWSADWKMRQQPRGFKIKGA